MELADRIKERIQDIAQRRSNVTLAEIEWVMEKLGDSYKVRRRDARHGVLFGIENLRFMVNHHNPGNKQVKSYSVDEFVSAMIELGLYEEEQETKNE
jgi:hypothetical protein